MPHSIDNVCSFSIDKASEIILMQWHGYATSSQFRAICESMLQLMKEHNIWRVLADTTHMKMISMEDQKWLDNEWLPRAIAAGYEKCAIIVSPDYFTRVTVDSVVSKIDQNQLEIRYFDDVSAAREWLAR